MIVKTGANYQAEGGYIEFAKGNSTATVNGAPVPSTVYSDSVRITGLQKFYIKRAEGISGTCRYVDYAEYTAVTGEKFYDYHTVGLNEGDTSYITLPTICGSLLTTPEGYHPKLTDESKNVKIVKTQTNYYLIVTGDSPYAVIELEANE